MAATVVAVVGAGNVGCALAGHLSLLGHEVRLVTRSEARLAPIREAGRLALTGAIEGTAEIALLTTSVADAVRGAQIVAVTVPTPALPFYAPALAESTSGNQLLWLNPGHSGGALFVAQEMRRRGRPSGRPICQLSTTTHGSRMTDATTVNVFQLAKPALAALPGREVDECRAAVGSLLRTEFTAAPHVLELDLANINALAHPAQMIANAGWIEATGGDFAIYKEGSGPAVAALIDAVDVERRAIAHRLGLATKSFGEILAEAGFSPVGSGSARETLIAATPIHGVKAPPLLDHRYLHEDVGWGLVQWIHLARAVDVPTPTMSALTHLAGVINGIDYVEAGLTLAKMGLDAVPAARIVDFVTSGPLS
jgi:opine dehydrogenase